MDQISEFPRIHIQITITWWQKRWNYSRKLQNIYIPITTSKGRAQNTAGAKAKGAEGPAESELSGHLAGVSCQGAHLVMSSWEEARADEASNSRGREPV